MTFLATWKRDGRVVLCADTAVTSAPVLALAAAQTSFGQTHLNTETCVEEAALKLFRVSPRILAGVVGDAEPAQAFLDRVHDRLVHGTPEEDLRSLLATLAITAEDQFGLAFGHLINGHPSLTYFESTGGVSSLDDVAQPALLAAGSLPPHLRQLVAQVSAATQKDLPADVADVATLAFMQSLSVNDYLIPIGVGGAFFMGSVDGNGVNWQPDVNFILYPPHVYAAAPAITAADSADDEHLPVDDKISYVRTLVRDDCALAVSSMGAPSVRAFASPTCAHGDSAEQLRALVNSGIRCTNRVLPS